MRKVLFFNNSFPTPKNPTQGTYAVTIANALVDAGADLKYVVLYRGNNKLEDYFKYYFHLLCMRIPSKDEILYINHYTTLIPLIVLMLFIHRRMIIHWHGEELLRDGWLYKILRFLIKKTFTSTTVHIAPSNYYKGVVIEKLNVPADRVIVSPSGGVDLNVFKERIVPKTDQLHIGFPAALNEHKGVGYLRLVIDNIQSIDRALGKKTYIHIIRLGEKCSELIDNIPTEFRDRIIIEEPFKKEEVARFYEGVHLSLFFSKRESLGLTVIESMSCGVPVIARKNTSMPELIVPGVSGELISDNPTFDEILVAVIKMSQSLLNYNPRQKAAEFSYERVVLQYKSILSTYL